MSSDMVSVSSASEKTDALMDSSMNISPESAPSRAESDSDSDIKALDNHGNTDHDPAADEELRRLQVLYPTHELAQTQQRGQDGFGGRREVNPESVGRQMAHVSNVSVTTWVCVLSVYF